MEGATTDANHAGEPIRRGEVKKFLAVAVLVFLLALLGFDKTPEAQVGEALTAAMLAGNAIAIGGCAHAALKSPAPNPTMMPPETGG